MKCVIQSPYRNLVCKGKRWRTSANSVVLLMCERKKSYRITTSERKLVLICYLNIHYMVKYMQKRIAITETNGKYSICFKYYL